jgi:small GTP-binding protein
MSASSVCFRVATGRAAAAPVAVFELFAGSASDLDDALSRLSCPRLAPGHVTLRDVLGVDRALVARVSGTSAQINPHGGRIIVARLAEALAAAGFVESGKPDPSEVYPEARGAVEAFALDALARVQSSRAVPLLLDQARRWRARGAHGATPAGPETAALAPHAILRRLLEPPLVVAMGATNIGKSTLLNALAGTRVAIVADEPGTTRDHVGILLDCDGLVVRYADTPGLRAPGTTLHPVEAEAIRASLELATRADLLLLLTDAKAAAPTVHAPGVPAITVGLRADLGPSRTPAAVSVANLHASVDPEALVPLLVAIRESLVPARVLEDPRPWRFWGDDGARERP